ncbi:MAG: type II secretion system F family protein [Alphaproteobacteria bacterium]|nr:type II secretion system F family protein [Alphaproteobacteria bacterium]
MQYFACKTLNKNGEVVAKSVFAEENFDFVEFFKKSDLLFISKMIRKSSIKKPIAGFTLPFFRNLAHLIKNKLNLLEALKIIKNLFKNEEAQAIVSTVIQQIYLGESLSQVLSKFNRYFDRVCIKSIEISEKTAELPDTLEKIVLHLEKKEKLKHRIKESMRYPIILMFFIGCVFIFWLFVLVPKFGELFSEMNVELPAISRIVISFSKMMSDHALYILSIVVGLVFVLKYVVNKYKLTTLSSTFCGKLKRDINIYNFFVAMEIMLYDKINLLEALECTEDIIPQVREVIDSVSSGVTLLSALRRSKILNEYELSIIGAAERAGNLWSAFQSASDISRQNIENKLQRIVAFLQPIAITFIGILLVVFVYAMIFPLYSNLNAVF